MFSYSICIVHGYSFDPTHPISPEETEILVLDDGDDDDNPPCSVDYAVIAQHQLNDAPLQALLNTQDYEQLQVNGETLIFYQQKICIPTSLIDQVITWYHEILGHPGPTRTFKTISMHFHFKGMEARVKLLIHRCSCQKNKRVTRPYGHLPPNLQQYDPWKCVQVDLFGPWSYTDANGIDRFIRAVSFIDVATRWPELHSYNEKSSEEISLIFDQQ